MTPSPRTEPQGRDSVASVSREVPVRVQCQVSPAGDAWNRFDLPIVPAPSAAPSFASVAFVTGGTATVRGRAQRRPAERVNARPEPVIRRLATESISTPRDNNGTGFAIPGRRK